MRSKISKIIVTLLMMLSLMGVSFANEVTVVVNEQPINNDNFIVLKDGILYAGISDYVQRHGGSTEWYENAELAVVQYEGHFISFKLDANQVAIDQEVVSMKQPTLIIDNKTYAPLSFLTEQFSDTLLWNDQTLTLRLTSENFALKASDLASVVYTEADILWLSRIVEVEGSTSEMKLAIANVVLNRVKSGNFPSTIYDVIFQAGKYKQFPPAHKSSFQTLQPSMNSVLVAKMAMGGENNIGNSLYFNNAPFKSKSGDLYAKIDGEYFYK